MVAPQRLRPGRVVAVSPLAAAAVATLAVLLALLAVATGIVASAEALARSLRRRRARSTTRPAVPQTDPYRQALRLAGHHRPSGTPSWPR